MVNNSKETLSIIRNAVIRLFPDCRVILFGSRARNENSSDSDYDFLVITKNTIEIHKKRFYKSLLRKELAKYKIRCAAIAPGYINTEMVAAIKPEALERITSQVPLKRLGEMHEISQTVTFIIENDFVNGKILEIDGGLRI